MTITEFIQNEKTKDIQMSTFHYPKLIQTENKNFTAIVNYESILDHYVPVLRDYIVEIELTDNEATRYMFNLKKLSYKLYNTTEYWFTILFANEWYSGVQFDGTQKKIKVFSSDGINKIKLVLGVDSPFIQIYQSELNSDKKRVIQEQNAMQ